MKAILIRDFGDADHLHLEEMPDPTPAPGEITIDVAYAGVGLVDVLLRGGRFDFAKPPLVPGIEVSGTVRALGDGVTGFAPGQRVAALLTDFTSGGMGGYAEIARAKAALTIPLAPEDELATAAATAVNGATAFMALEGVPRGAVVAISGASGGLGQSLITAALTSGARSIIAISGSPARRAALLQAGATVVVTPGEFEGFAEPLDAAFDTVGGPLRAALLRHLRPAGRLVLLGNASGLDEALSGDEIWMRSVIVEGLSTGGISHLAPERIAKAASLALLAGRGRTEAIAVFDLDRAADAHRALEARQGPGKFVLKVA